MTWHIGVDIGGTFIDFCAHNSETQALRRRMNLFLLAALLGAAVTGLLVSLAARG